MPAPTLATTLLGSERVQGNIVARAYAAPGVFRLEFDDTGTFDVHAADRVIAWHPGPQANEPAFRADLLGRVLALALHADGSFTLHASAVSIDGEAIAFLGPKHAGKSTTALALVRVGARLLADDAVVVRLGPNGTPIAAAGVQRPRLWADSVRALGVSVPASAGDKPTLEPLPDHQLERAAVSLRACYVLNPVRGESGSVARRERLSPVHAALSLVQFSKLGALLGGTEAPVILDRAASLAGSVPAYSIQVNRDLLQLDALAAQIMEWHRPAAAPRSGS